MCLENAFLKKHLLKLKIRGLNCSEGRGDPSQIVVQRSLDYKSEYFRSNLAQ